MTQALREKQRQLFCERPRDDEARRDAELLWKERLQRDLQEALRRLVQEPHRLTAQDRFRIREALASQGGLPGAAERPAPAGPRPALVQEFAGAVREVTEEAVAVEFEIGAGVESRWLSRRDLNVPSVHRGDAARLRCELVLLPPYGPGETPVPPDLDEMEAWEQELHRRAEQGPPPPGASS
jgi:hypothetical protein